MAIVFKHRYKSDSMIGTGTIKFRPYTVASPLSISYALTNCTADSTNPTEIVVGKTYDFGFTADSGYEFTGSGTTSVSGGTIVAWDYPDTSDLTRITVAIEVTGNLTITQIASVSLPQLATPANVSAESTTVSWDEVENATSYEVFADGVSIGTVENETEDALAGTWVFNEEIISDFSNTTISVNFSSNNTIWTGISCDIMPKMTEITYSNTDSMDTVYDSLVGGWMDESYKTITITSKLSEVTDGETLLAWLQANATKQ